MFKPFKIPLAVEKTTCYLGHGTFLSLTLLVPIASNEASPSIKCDFLQLVLCLVFIVVDGGGQWGLNTF